MFVNGDAIGVAIKVLTAGLMLLCLALASHVVWISRLVRSRSLGQFSPAARVTLLALAAATPVISFYCAGMVGHLRRHAPYPNPVGTGKTVLGTVGALATVMLVLLAIAQLGQPAPGLHGPDGSSRLLGMILVLAVPCAVLGMACQVLVRSSRARAGLIAVAGGTAMCLFLLV